MTNPDQEEKATLKYRMQGAGGEIGHWGHEYVRHISGMWVFNEELLPFIFWVNDELSFIVTY